MKRRGVTQEQAQRALISNPTVIGAIMVQRGEADANDLRYGGRLS